MTRVFEALRACRTRFPALWLRRRATSVPARWIRRPDELNERICLFVLLARGQRILPHSITHARAWRDAGFDVIVVVVAESAGACLDLRPLSFASGVLQRANVGYDFGAWSSAINALETQLHSADVVVLANDSVLGPSERFPEMVRFAYKADADVLGATMSAEGVRHLQSYLLVFRQAALRSPAFWSFWRSVRCGDRRFVISMYELQLTSLLEAAGLRIESIYPAHGPTVTNPTLSNWEALAAQGFPYIKVELLRDDPAGCGVGDWQRVARQASFDIAELDAQVAALEECSDRSWAIRASAT